MNNILQMLTGKIFQQAPQMLVKQLENRLKMTNPQVYKEFQEARQNNVDPQEYLNKITNGFNQQQKEQWNMLMNGINQKR